jgi:hypothetical protein
MQRFPKRRARFIRSSERLTTSAIAFQRAQFVVRAKLFLPGGCMRPEAAQHRIELICQRLNFIPIAPGSCAQVALGLLLDCQGQIDDGCRIRRTECLLRWQQNDPRSTA